MLAVLAAVAGIATAPIPPAPTRWLEDHAAFLSPATSTALDLELAGYEHATGHQVVVWIGRTLDGAPLDDWAVRTFAAWKVGRAKIDDGVVMFILADDHAIDIEVGYGLEGVVTDAAASRIIHDVMTPPLRAGERDRAVTAGVHALLSTIEGKPWTGSSASSTPRQPTAPPWDWIGIAIFAVVLLLVSIKHPRLALWLLASAIGRGGGSSGGGFSGRGGRSGGGGARGTW